MARGMKRIARSAALRRRDCKPGAKFLGNLYRQAAISEAGEKNPVATESRASRDADNAALASGRHLPQQVPTPSSRVRSRRLAAPPLTATRICRSDTALHTQTIMAAIVNANANDCQYHINLLLAQRVACLIMSNTAHVMKYQQRGRRGCGKCSRSIPGT